MPCLSLNCAIVDLSDKVFADGMAYVALSRVRSLNGLYLTAFDAQSIRVSKNSVAISLFTMWNHNQKRDVQGSRERPLTRPDMRRVKRVMGDGNCMFRALSLVVTGNEDQHHAIRTRIVQNMREVFPTSS